MSEVKHEVLLQAKGIYKNFETSKKDQAVHALTNVDLALYRGETLALVGESGCGKSTVAGILAGSLTPGSGRVTANGMPVTQLTRAARMQAMTLVPHDAKLFKGTVETNMRMAAPQRQRARTVGCAGRGEPGGLLP